MKKAIFNDIYNQFTPDQRVIDGLFERIEKEDRAAKRFPYKPVLAVASVAALAVLSVGISRIIPHGEIEIEDHTMPPFSETEENEIIVTTEATSEKTTQPPEETDNDSSNPTVTEPIVTSVSEEIADPVTSVSETLSSSEIVEEIVTGSNQSGSVTDKPSEISDIEIVTITVTEPPVTDTAEIITSEEEDIPEDIEVEIDDEVQYEDLPVFGTLGEYFEYFNYNELPKKAVVSYNTIEIMFSMRFSVSNNRDMDWELAESIVEAVYTAEANENASIKVDGSVADSISVTIGDHFSLSVYEHGIIKLSAEKANYLGSYLFVSEKNVYETLYDYVAEIDPAFAAGEEGVVAIDDTVATDEEVLPDEDITEAPAEEN